MSKIVGIIGCGPSGLTAAKALKEIGLKPCIFEAGSKIGGLWSDINGKVPSTLRTNVSKYHCNFSDFPWPNQQEMFPTAVQMEKYLNLYAGRFLTNDEIFLNCKVIAIRENRSDKGNLAWDISYVENSLEERTKTCQYVIIASGIFAKPFIPGFATQSNFIGQIYHSSSNELKDNCEGKVVVVVGSSLSGVEACTDALTFGAKKVIHVCSTSFWIMPRYLPKDTDTKCPAFLPIDLLLFTRNPTQGPKEMIEFSAEEWKKKNQIIRTMLKGQEIISKCINPNDERPLNLAVSDTYAEFVRNGAIDVVSGRAENLNENSIILCNGKLIASDIVIFGTGFKLHIPFIPETLIPDYEPNDLFQPLLLHKSMFHPSLPGIGFVGMYSGPYFGINELQAKYIAAVMDGSIPWPTIEQQKQSQEIELAIRNRIPKPQFPHSDYPGRADEIAHELNIEAQKLWPARDVSMVIPSTYSNSIGAKQTLEQLDKDLVDAENGRFVPPAIFRNLHGNWTFKREISSSSLSCPSGNVEGEARFILKSNSEYHYLENGVFEFHENKNLETKQEYLYKLSDSENKLQVYFTDSRLFHELKLSRSSEGWMGHGHHLCGQDDYNVEYIFPFEGAYMNNFLVQYKVKGSKKEYVSKTFFTKKNL